MMKIVYPIRINKYLAINNYSTRKGGDELIKNKMVLINNRIARLGDMVEEKDKIVVKNIKKDFVYYAYNKEVGISTNKDSKAKDILSTSKFPKKVFPIGRLDKDSHGLIILTDDGRITDRLLSPKYIHEKEYLVKVEPNFTNKFIKLMGNGVHFDGIISRKCKVWADNPKGKISNNTFRIILTEGKKRQIRRMCEALHHKVIDLKRVRVMNIELKDLGIGKWREVKGEELETFLKSLNIK